MAEGARCNLCGANQGFLVLEDAHVPYRVLKCRSCTLVFVHPQPPPNFLVSHYAPSYYEDWERTQALSRARMWNKRLKRIERAHERGHILDVGCGDGVFLKMAQRQGWRIDGTELSSYAATHVSHHLGVPIYCGELYAAPYHHHTFDVVTIWHVLEHTRDPLAYLVKARELLKPNGLLVLAVPNVHNIMMQIAYRIVRRRKLELFSPDDRELHLYHFSPQTILSYLHQSGFELVKLFPDFGIVDLRKQILNLIATMPYYLVGLKIFDAMEVWATPLLSGRLQ